MKAYITKYALTSGIQEVDDASEPEYESRMISVRSLGVFANFHGEGREWHRTKESAVAKAEQMRLAKIVSLKKSIKKLESLNFA
jgi:hypothetical protein